MAHLNKVVLKNSTSLSINERFTYLRRNPEQSPVQRLRDNNAILHQATAKNRRLAQQMERRPAVMAALKIKKKSLRQRLGQQQFDAVGGGTPRPVHDRLAFAIPVLRPTLRGGRARGRARAGGRGGRFSNSGRIPLNRLGISTSLQQINVLRSQRPVLRGRINSRGRASLSVGLRGRSPHRLRGVGLPRGISLRGQFRGVARAQVRGQFRGRRQLRGQIGVQGRIQTRGFSRGRGGVQQGRGGVQQGRGGVQQGRGGVQQGRGGARGRGGVRGRGNLVRGQQAQGRWARGRGAARGRQQQAHMSKEDLDQQLDQYMSSTRTHLDEELDTYMTETW